MEYRLRLIDIAVLTMFRYLGVAVNNKLASSGRRFRESLSRESRMEVEINFWQSVYIEETERSVEIKHEIWFHAHSETGEF